MCLQKNPIPSDKCFHHFRKCQNFQLAGCRRSFTSDLAYWSFAVNRLFKKIGARSFVFESDPSGTLLGGSHAFATARDWARFGQLFLQVPLPFLLPPFINRVSSDRWYPSMSTMFSESWFRFLVQLVLRASRHTP